MPHLTNPRGREELDLAVGNLLASRAALTSAALRYLAGTILAARPDAVSLSLTCKIDDAACLITQEIQYADGTSGHTDDVDEDLLEVSAYFNTLDLTRYAARGPRPGAHYKLDLRSAAEAAITPSTAIEGDHPHWTVAGVWTEVSCPTSDGAAGTRIRAPWIRHVQAPTAAAAGIAARAEEAGAGPEGAYLRPCGCAAEPTVTITFPGYHRNLTASPEPGR